ncbi:MAG: hypothetical protein KGY67_07820, partial [Candidatus Thermoplasmatota archaeon]|nr:hypothetical protein [Candidatus Thermoplasmatota archaeon]
MNKKNKSIHRHWISLLLRAIRFTFFEEIPTSKLVTQSYNQISPGYDTTWTTHMRDKSIELINNLQLDNVENALDLSCGTGCITNMLSTHT